MYILFKDNKYLIVIMFLCGGKKQKTQMRTLALESHLFTLRNNTEDILKI